ncbi:MAG: C10 family peptidase [Candidatus Zixiibacteriota bacterium]
MKKALLIVLLLLLSNKAFMQSIDYETAYRVASRHTETFVDDYQIGRYMEILLSDGRLAGHLFELMPKGYIVVSPDVKLPPIMIYSKIGQFKIDDQNALLHLLKQDMETFYSLDKLPKDIKTKNNAKWQRYLEEDPTLITEIEESVEYGPWILTHWHQRYPYNLRCPVDPITGEICFTGCVATACAMVCNYWEWPPSILLDDGNSYSYELLGRSMTIDAPLYSMDTIIYSEDFKVEPDADNASGLTVAIGVLAHSAYTSEGTGATIDTLHEYFNCDLGFYGSHIVSPFTMFDGYFESIQLSVMRGKPVVMSLFDYYVERGHALVVDGWREDGYFHANYGWGGYSDGWYNFIDWESAEEDKYPNFATVNITAPPKPDIPGSFDEALEIPMHSTRRRLLQGITFHGDIDMYKFSACSDSLYQFYAEGPRHTKIEIYDSEYNLLETKSNGGNNWNFSILFDPIYDGYYYAAISATDTIWEANYNLFFSRMPALDPQKIELISPSGGEEVVGGENMSIFFTREGEPAIEFVRAEYSISGIGGPWHMIKDSVANNYIRWELPILPDDKYNCYIKVAAISNEDIFAMNDIGFKILNPSKIDENKELPKKLEITMMPNPFNGSCRIITSQKCQVKILDVSGKLVFQGISEGELIWMPHEKQESGKYILMADFGHEKKISQIIYIK